MRPFRTSCGFRSSHLDQSLIKKATAVRSATVMSDQRKPMISHLYALHSRRVSRIILPVWRASALAVVISVPAAEAPIESEPLLKPTTGMEISDSDRQFWSFQPVISHALPAVQNREWAKAPIDSFVLERLENHSINPAPPASRQDLVRRLFFDLTGLPPDPEEIRRFISDPSPLAYEQLVDRLLNSPHYGERQAQHWLDVVRYAETEGFEYDRDLPDGWRFRDYVINAFNRDLPYDEFIRQQLAGDEIDPSDPELLIATGFHRLGAVRRNAGNQEVSSSRNEVLTERTDIVGAAFLGLTIGCARCHDHKFDPIPQKDYYAIQAFLAATHENDVVLGDPDQSQQWTNRTAQINREIRTLQRTLQRSGDEAKEQIRAQIAAAENSLPPPPPMIATITNMEPTEIHVLKRGNWDSKGERVAPRGLDVLLPTGASSLPPDTQNRRIALAEWLTEANHPLTARVMVNRIWSSHFGTGIVKTANDFGKNGDRPSHPELLDYLAGEFVRNGWRAKPIHRMILVSNTYRQSAFSPETAAAEKIDPENRLLWRFNRRRLEAEEIRDAMLAVSGRLNPSAGGRSVMIPVDPELVNQLYKPSQWTVSNREEELCRRSIYLIAKRNLRLPFMEVFDQPASQISCAGRQSSTHAPQALELLNGRTANELAHAFADRIRREAGPEPNEQIDYAYRLATGRYPTGAEKTLALAFLASQPLKELALALFNLNAFLYVN